MFEDTLRILHGTHPQRPANLLAHYLDPCRCQQADIPTGPALIPAFLSNIKLNHSRIFVRTRTLTKSSLRLSWFSEYTHTAIIQFTEARSRTDIYVPVIYQWEIPILVSLFHHWVSALTGYLPALDKERLNQHIKPLPLYLMKIPYTISYLVMLDTTCRIRWCTKQSMSSPVRISPKSLQVFTPRLDA